MRYICTYRYICCSFSGLMEVLIVIETDLLQVAPGIPQYYMNLVSEELKDMLILPMSQATQRDQLMSFKDGHL